MSDQCPCGKRVYTTTAEVYRTLHRKKKRVKGGSKSTSGLRRDRTAPGDASVKHYRCAYGSIHMGHTGDA